MNGHVPHFEFVSALMGVAAAGQSISAHEAQDRVAALAEQVRSCTRSLPRDRAVDFDHLAVLRLAFILSQNLAQRLVVSWPSLAVTDEYAGLLNALDDFDNEVENHELGHVAGPLLSHTRTALAAHR